MNEFISLKLYLGTLEAIASNTELTVYCTCLFYKHMLIGFRYSCYIVLANLLKEDVTVEKLVVVLIALSPDFTDDISSLPFMLVVLSEMKDN